MNCLKLIAQQKQVQNYEEMCGYLYVSEGKFRNYHTITGCQFGYDQTEVVYHENST